MSKKKRVEVNLTILGSILLIYMIFNSPLISAQDNGLNDFDEKMVSSGVLPPLTPNIDMGSDQSYIELELYDYHTKEKIKEIHTIIKLENIDTKKNSETLKYIDDRGVLTEYVTKGKYQIILKVDKIETDGKDFCINFELDANDNITKKIYLLPVGSVRGTVYDKNKNAIVGANIKFDCSGNYGETINKKTDSFGTFTNEWLPVGNCKITTEYQNTMGTTYADIKQGEISDIKINLDEKLYGNSKQFSLYITIMILILICVFILYMLIKNSKKEKITISNRTEDIMKTLEHNEKEVINYILKQGNKSSQANISFNTGIPKTSLIRVFDKLENKKIINIERIGKFKKIELTSWFLGKE